MTIHDAPRFVTVDDFSVGQRLDNYLIKQLKGVPRSRIYRIIRKGEVRVNKGFRKDLGRPTINPKENKKSFMKFLEK